MLYQSGVEAETALAATWRWANFSIAELSCRCGGRFCAGAYWHDEAFLDGLQSMRDDIGKPLRLNSAHRCPQWNGAVGGAPLSQHKTMAADISLSGHDRFALFSAAKRHGFRGFGLANSFLHVDRRVYPATWYYGGSKRRWQT